ncbi:MurR/RpiR family transcriptional regulator [Oceanobacillus senegalensis]|uniref:MurR/RpiR family transcriptional regulator n=1 Tax=Oceanobacillus senegalensis TaxID=1936063 RepID=UPI000A30453C|nr:MurR/RpiR family transcriptional regulator [Oceanobacillus senegalensis]
MLFEERVQKYEYKLNDTDDQIIEYLMEHKQDVIHLTIQQIASELFTVPNTIMRLSKKLGYDGFSHLKNSLKGELEEKHHKVDNTAYHHIQKTFELLDHKMIQTSFKLLKDSKHVLFFAVGDSSDLCKRMVRHLRVSGKLSEFSPHRHEVLHRINEMGKQDVLFLISLTGETELVLEIARIAKERGVTIISLTHFNRNTLQGLADVRLYCYSPYRSVNGYNTTDHTPAIIVLQALSQYFWDHY